MIDMASTDLRRSSGLSNKTKVKYCLFAKFQLALIKSCDVAEKPHIFITRANQCIQEINRDRTLSYSGLMVLVENQEQK